MKSSNSPTSSPALLQPPSSPGGQRTATKIPFPAVISLPPQPPQPPLQPSQPPLQPPPRPPPRLLHCPHPPRPLPLPRLLIFVVLTQTTQHIMKVGIAINVMRPTHPAGQPGRSPLEPLLLKTQLSASHLPTHPTCPLSPAGQLIRTTGLLPQRLRPQNLQNLVEAGMVGGPALREKKPGLPPTQPHLPVPALQPQRPPMRACPLLNTAAWIPASKCC